MLQEHTNYLQQIIENSKGMVEGAKQREADVEAFLTKSYGDFPIAPNVLAHTKHFSNLCGGKVNTPMSISAAHSGSGFTWFTYLGKAAAGSTMEVVTLDKIAAKGMPMDSTLSKAAGSPRGSGFYGSDFRVLLFDMYLPAGHQYTYLMNQGCPTFTGWGKGQFKTQSRVFVNVLAQTGTARIDIHANAVAAVSAGKAELGKKWEYKTGARWGWGGCHQPRVYGTGRIKVAIALPYASVGYHGPDNFVWAGFVGKGTGSGRWSHNDVIVN